MELFGLFLTPLYTAVDLMFFLYARSLVIVFIFLYLPFKKTIPEIRPENAKFLTKKKHRVFSIVPQYLEANVVKNLTTRLLQQQPAQLRKNCMNELKEKLA